MQTPCDAEFCLPGGMHADEDECPGSDDETHHCVDCGQLWWDDKGSTCNSCGSYWCPDWQQTFAGSLCKHLEQIYENLMDASKKNELTEALESLEEPTCSTCLLRTPIDCKVEGCKWSRAELLKKWIDFCKRPIVHSWAKLVRHHETVDVEVCYVRVERSEDDPEVTEPWIIDFKTSMLKINTNRQVFTGENALQAAIAGAKNQISLSQLEGYIYKVYLGEESRGGALRKSKSRDSSPKRKKQDK